MKDFRGFKFGNIHTKDLHLEVVSSSSRYTKNLLPEPTDYKMEIPGGNGNYYWGQTFSTREFTISIAFDSVDEITWRRMAQLFATDKLKDLIFDENPYKVYRAKLKQAPDLKYVCFKDRDTQKRIYKGEGTLNFICYHPLAYCFNKYVVRAADYYKCTQPQVILNRDSIECNPYEDKKPPKMLPGLIKDHYNVKDNMKTPWKGGYPTIEQVQWGELYFNLGVEDKNNKMIIDVRDYWNNIPKWQETAKLLTTPTLDYEQELIYMPQYSKVNYYNMDTGLNKQNGLIGSRILVYNPGDVPVDFELRLGNLTSDFRNNLKDYTFRISRYNVQRLTIDQAVDWTGLKTRDRDDSVPYKYGTRYFTIAEAPALDISQDGDFNPKVYQPTYRELKNAHPTHCYIAEPIPQEHLGHFIKLFYWQSNLLFNKFENGEPAASNMEHGQNEFYSYTDLINTTRHIFNHEQGIELANRYEELRELCINDDERNELYWNTLKIGIYDRYAEFNEMLDEQHKIFTDTYTYEDFVYDMIYNPQQYIRDAEDLNYGEFLFNITRLPQWCTFDYFDITSKNFDKIPYAKCACDLEPKENHHREQVQPLFLDSEKRMLYNIHEPEWKNCPDFPKTYPEKEKNFFNYKPNKLIFNENIKHGHWFQLPPGWSLIDISPVVDETIWGGKRWLDARPFDWGTTDTDFRKAFNNIYRAAAIEYLSQNCPKEMRERYATSQGYSDDILSEDVTEEQRLDWNTREDINTMRNSVVGDKTAAELYEAFSAMPLETLEDYLQFRRWFEKDSNYKAYADIDKAPYEYRAFSKGFDEATKNLTCDQVMKILFTNLGYEIMQYRKENAEIGFLKMLADYWRVNQGREEFESKSWAGSDVDDWWWYANNYIWNNFPPLYWGYADLLNHLQIKYIPQYY